MIIRFNLQDGERHFVFIDRKGSMVWFEMSPQCRVNKRASPALLSFITAVLVWCLTSSPHDIQYSCTQLTVKIFSEASRDSCFHFVKTTYLLQRENILCSSCYTGLRACAFEPTSVHRHNPCRL
jgi:hypothetical protein